MRRRGSWLPGFRFLRPLSLGFVEEDSSGDGGIEGFDDTGGDADGDGLLADAGGDATALATDDDGAGAGEVGLRDGLGGAGESGVQSHTFLF